MTTRCTSLQTLVCVAGLLLTIPGCVGLASPHPLSRRAPRMANHRSEKMALRPGETCAVARANEPKDLKPTTR